MKLFRHMTTGRNKQPQRPSRPSECDECPNPPVLWARATRRWLCRSCLDAWMAANARTKLRSCYCGSYDWHAVSPSFVQCPSGHQATKEHVRWVEPKTAEDAWTEYIEQNSTAAERAEAARMATPDRVRQLHWDLPTSQLVDCIEACEWVAWAAEQPKQPHPPDCACCQSRNRRANRGWVSSAPAFPASGAGAPEDRYVDDVHPIDVVQGDGPNGHRAGCMCRRCRVVERTKRDSADIAKINARETELVKAIRDLKMDTASKSGEFRALHSGTNRPGQIVMLEPGEHVIPTNPANCDCEWDEVMTGRGVRKHVLTRQCVMHSTHGNFLR